MKILILLLGRIGDMILFTPFIDILKSKYPNCYIDIICSKHNYPIIQNNPNIHNLIVYTKNFGNHFSVLLKIISQKYDLYIDPKDHYSTESYIFSRIVRAKTKIGFTKNNKNNFDYKITKKSPLAKKHFSLKTMQAFKYLDIEIPNNPPKPILYENNSSKKYVEEFLENIPNQNIKIQINISASKEIRIWEMKNWQEVIQNFKNNSIISFILTCEPKHKKLAEQLSGSNLYKFNARNISDIISLVKKCDIIVSPDTSIVHIASAFNKPIIALYTSNDQNFVSFAPLSDIKFTLFPPNESGNINNISVNRVVDSLNNLLNILQDAHN